MNTKTTMRGRRCNLSVAIFVAVAATTAVYAPKPERVRRVTPDGDLHEVLDNASPGDIVTLPPGMTGAHPG